MIQPNSTFAVYSLCQAGLLDQDAAIMSADEIKGRVISFQRIGSERPRYAQISDVTVSEDGSVRLKFDWQELDACETQYVRYSPRSNLWGAWFVREPDPIFGLVVQLLPPGGLSSAN